MHKDLLHVAYCPFYKECKKGKTCTHALTPSIKRLILQRKIIARMYISHPLCYKNNMLNRRNYGNIDSTRNE